LTQYDIAIYHWPPEWVVRAIDVSGIFSIEFVHRTDTSSCNKKVPDVVVSHSQYVLDYIEKTYHRHDRICLVPNGTDTEHFLPNSDRQSQLLVGAPTSYYRLKGIDVLINAWHLLPKEYKDRYKLVLHGAGTEKEDFDWLVEKTGENIELLGPIVDTKAFYDSLFLYVTAARIEGLPISILEAMSSNLPVIASDIDGHRVINDLAQKAGFEAPLILFNSENAKDLAKAMQRFFDTPTQSNTRSTTEALFSGKAHCTGLADVIQRYYSGNAQNPVTDLKV
jgi:glycosyltransferase involved in cell wall biosynthesis